MRPYVQAYYIESSGRECYELDMLIRMVVVCSAHSGESQNGEVLDTSGCVVWNLSAEPDVYMSANSTSCFNPVGDRSRINKASSRGQACKYRSIIVN